MRKIFVILLCLFSFSGCFPALEKSIFEFLSIIQMMQGRNSDYQLFVQVTGLSGLGLIIQVNGGSDLSIEQDGEFVFAQNFKANDSYDVSILTQPSDPTQTCSVAGGKGVFGSGSVRSVVVNCDPERFTIGGNIVGLEGITGLTITNNGGDSVTIFSPSGSFAFSTPLSQNATYNVEVASQPNHPLQECTIVGGSGTVTNSPIDNIAINCTTLGYPVEIEVTGLSSGTLALRLNGNQNLNITANGIYLFPTNILIGEVYNLEIFSQPANHICAIDPSAGVIAAAKITVDTNCFSVIDQTPRNQTVILPNQSIKFVFSDSVNAGSCVGVGPATLDLVVGSPDFVLSTTNIANDTLTVTTNGSAWNKGAGRNVTLECTSDIGKPLGSTNIYVSYTIPSEIRYVKDVGGNDVNDGLSPATAKRSIQAALNTILVCPGLDCAVLVEQGAYDPNSILDSIVMTVDGVSLYGSYVPGTDYTLRNETARNSIIFMDSPPAFCATALVGDPCKIIHATATLTNATQIYGFTISGGTGLAIAGIYTEGGAVIRNNTITAGLGGTHSFGIATLNANSILINNTVTGGSCTNNACATAGIKIHNTAGSTYTIQFNNFTGGSCLANACRSSGLELQASGTPNFSNVTNNSFVGGNIDTIYTNAQSQGYQANGNYAGELHSNLFQGGDAQKSFGFYSLNGLGIALGTFTLGNIIKSGNATVDTTGLHISGNGARTVRNNIIESGNVTSINSSHNYGVNIIGNGNLTFENNLVKVGSSNSTASFAVAYGINIGTIPGTSTVIRNRIVMGTVNGFTNGSTNYGIQSTNGGAYAIANNWIEPGVSNFKSYGIDLVGHFNLLKIFHNTISSGAGATSGLTEVATLNLGNSTQLEIRNNILILNSNSGENACIEYDGGALGAIFSNAYFNCNKMINHGGMGISLTNICPLGQLGNFDCSAQLVGANFQENTNINPSLRSPLTSPYDFRLSETSPCSITRNPNSIALVVNDIFGNSRPGSVPGVSLGSHEYDGVCLP